MEARVPMGFLIAVADDDVITDGDRPCASGQYKSELEVELAERSPSRQRSSISPFAS